ncbi:hypothetical protein ACT4YP_20600 (plasmid) [Acinetobacter baumannii]
MYKILLVCLASILPITSFAADSFFMTKAQSQIKELMKDPDSTKFRNLREITNTKGESVLCGQINSKNSYGGYPGFMSFSFSNGNLNIIDDSTRNEFKIMQAVSKYELDGCDGEKVEKLARNPQIYKNYCAAFYQGYTDVIADNVPAEKAYETILKKYKEENLNLLFEKESDLKMAFEGNLKQMQETPKAVKILKKKRPQDTQQYINNCAAMAKAFVEKQPKN